MSDDAPIARVQELGVGEAHPNDVSLDDFALAEFALEELVQVPASAASDALGDRTPTKQNEIASPLPAVAQLTTSNPNNINQGELPLTNQSLDAPDLGDMVLEELSLDDLVLEELVLDALPAPAQALETTLDPAKSESELHGGSSLPLGQVVGVASSDAGATALANLTGDTGGLTAQAITCGAWSLAVSFTWANQIVDEFELVPIPKAPSWLLGAVNIEGSIVPVIDMGEFLSPNKVGRALGREHRLLLGGRTPQSNEDAVAILFTGLPFQVSYARARVASSVELPERLLEVCKNMAHTSDGRALFELDTARFVDVMALNLI